MVKHCKKLEYYLWSTKRQLTGVGTTIERDKGTKQNGCLAEKATSL